MLHKSIKLSFLFRPLNLKMEITLIAKNIKVLLFALRDLSTDFLRELLSMSRIGKIKLTNVIKS